MCGLFGIIQNAKANFNKRKYFDNFVHNALEVGVVRGPDSTGMFQLRQASKLARAYKGPWSGSVFAQNANAKELITNSDSSLITVGHHRSATVGSVSAQNAHPFEHKVNDRQIIGVHNGNISNSKFFDDGQTFSVDSDWAFHQIAKHGAAEAIANFDGAMVLVWYDSADGKLRIYSNGKRTVFWNFVKDEDVLIFASEHQMLYWLTSRNGIELEKQMWTTCDDRIYAFDPMDVRHHTQEILPKRVEAPKKTVTEFTAGRDAKGSGAWAGNTAGYSASKTFQGETISYDKKDVEALGLVLGDETDFFPSNKLTSGVTCNLVGDIMASKASAEIIHSIMINTNIDLRDNMERLTDEGGDCQVRIIGASRVNIKGKTYPCAVVSRPATLTIGARVIVVDRSPVVSLPIEVYKDGTKVSIQRALEIVRDGCFICEKTILLTDVRKGAVGWTETKKPMCPECMAHLKDDSASAELIIKEQHTEDK